MTYSARSNIDKAVAVVFPITAFVASGFEHSIANMYFIPLGLLIKHEKGVTGLDTMASADLSNLTWAGFFYRNLLPVTVGNIAGGALMVGIVYWFVYLRPAAPPRGARLNNGATGVSVAYDDEPRLRLRESKQQMTDNRGPGRALVCALRQPI